MSAFHFFSNPPALIPAIGANFGSSGPYANYVLLGTVPADAARQDLFAENHSTSVAVLILDDGSTAAGSVPASGKATTMALSAAAVAGGVGGVFADKFQGRVQVYGALSTSQVAVSAR
jgi:hypothetical protein